MKRLSSLIRQVEEKSLSSLVQSSEDQIVRVAGAFKTGFRVTKRNLAKKEEAAKKEETTKPKKAKKKA